VEPQLRFLMTIKYVGLFIWLSVLTTSCANFYITTESLRNQFVGIDSTSLKPVIVRGPALERYKYLANPIEQIDCIDKNGNPSRLKNSPSIEMRVTQTSGKRSVFYFDRIFVNDSLLVGVQSRFVSSIRKTIKLTDIKKIEVQDGKKNFHYVLK
jgi:hypothetical protein